MARILGRWPAFTFPRVARRLGRKLYFSLYVCDFGKFVGKIFGFFLEMFWLIFEPPGGGPWAPRGPKMGPGTPGIDLKSRKKIQKFGPEVSTIFEILIFGFGGVF